MSRDMKKAAEMNKNLKKPTKMTKEYWDGIQLQNYLEAKYGLKLYQLLPYVGSNSTFVTIYPSEILDDEEERNYYLNEYCSEEEKDEDGCGLGTLDGQLRARGLTQETPGASKGAKYIELLEILRKEFPEEDEFEIFVSW